MSDLISRQAVLDWLQEQKEDVSQRSNSAIFANGIAGARSRNKQK